MAGDRDPDIRVATPGESGRSHIIVSPFQFYVNGEDHLRVTTANSLSGVVLEIVGRFFDQDTQQITPLVERHQPNTDRSIKQTLIRLGKGYLLNLSVRAVTGSPLVGQTFVIVELVRGFDGATQLLGVLGQGYVTARQGIAWPGSPIQSSIEGGGYPRVIAATVPAAGVELGETVPTGARWRLKTLRALLVTAAGGSNRLPSLQFVSATHVYMYAPNPANLVASSNCTVAWSIGLPYAALIIGGISVSALPDGIDLIAGDSFNTSTLNLAAGDQWNSGYYEVEEFLEVNA